MESMTFLELSGQNILPYLDALARLRINIFKDYPYLYEGSPVYESKYLHKYVQSEQSRIIAVLDGESMVGASTCIPLEEEAEEVRQPFIDKGLAIQEFFYFGESVLEKSYRGRGIGHYFFDRREDFARSLGYQTTCFCAVLRPDHHPLKPVDYRPNDLFWQKRGYEKQPSLICHMEWPDIQSDESTQKSLIFWTRDLLGA